MSDPGPFQPVVAHALDHDALSQASPPATASARPAHRRLARRRFRGYTAARQPISSAPTPTPRIRRRRQFCRELPATVSVAVPVSAFVDDHDSWRHLVPSPSKQEHVIAEAADRPRSLHLSRRAGRHAPEHPKRVARRSRVVIHERIWPVPVFRRSSAVVPQRTPLTIGAFFVCGSEVSVNVTGCRAAPAGPRVHPVDGGGNVARPGSA